MKNQTSVRLFVVVSGPAGYFTPETSQTSENQPSTEMTEPFAALVRVVELVG